MKILECARCGAPLKAKLFGRSIKCNYCGAVNEQEKLATLHEEKPKNFSQPKKWTPPAHKQAPSREPMPYKRDAGDWLAALYFPGFVLLFGGAAAMDAWGGYFYGVVPADLAHLDVTRSPAAVGKDLQGANVGKTKVTADFRTGSAGPFKSIRLEWEESHPDAPQWLVLEPANSKSTPPADIEARLAADLHGGLSPQSDWKFGAVSVQYRKDGGGEINIDVDPNPHEGDNPLAARQAAVAMRVLAHAAFNQPLGVDPKEMREVFGGGYPVRTFLKIDPKTTGENSTSVMKGLFSGAFIHYRSFDVGLDHPLLSMATLEWDDPDEHGGRLRKITFRPTSAYHDKRESFVACLEKTLGPAVKTPQKKGAPHYHFELAKFPVEATFELLASDILEMDAFDVFPSDKWNGVFTAIDGCR